MTLRSEVG